MMRLPLPFILGFVLGMAVQLAVIVAANVAPVAIITRVVDGDTVTGNPCIACNERYIRLSGIDAPERGEPGGSAATAALTAILGDLPRAVIIDRRGTDNFGRTLATLRPLGGPDIGGTLIATGHAKPYRETHE